MGLEPHDRHILFYRELRCMYHLPGGAEADWFITVTADVELAFAAGLKVR